MTVEVDGNPVSSITVGVDRSSASLAALDWAAERASAQGVGLHIVHALDPFEGATASCLGVDRRRVAARMLVDKAVERALAVSAGLEVTGDVIDESPAEALTRQGSQMICIGYSGVAAAHPGHRASIATELLLTAQCEVVVVRPSPVIATGWVVAEIPSEPTASDLLRTAIQEAVLRRAPLRLLCADEQTRARLVEDVARWRTRHAELDVVVASGEWRLDQFLERYAKQIALFVAPPRHLHDIGTVLHASAATALTALDCPLLICGSGYTSSIDDGRVAGTSSAKR